MAAKFVNSYELCRVILYGIIYCSNYVSTFRPLIKKIGFILPYCLSLYIWYCLRVFLSCEYCTLLFSFFLSFSLFLSTLRAPLDNRTNQLKKTSKAKLKHGKTKKTHSSSKLNIITSYIKISGSKPIIKKLNKM